MRRFRLLLKMVKRFGKPPICRGFYLNQKPWFIIFSDDEIYLSFFFIPKKIEAVVAESSVCPKVNSFKEMRGDKIF